MTSTPDIRFILVPHDFSETAERALAYALTFAKKLAARVVVLHVYEVPTLGYPDALVASLELAAEVERVTGKALADVADRARRSNVEIETILRRGTPWSEINAVAEEMKADLIIMGTHGRRGVSRMLLGSVAERVVRTAPCPVLTVHSSAALPGDAAGKATA